MRISLFLQLKTIFGFFEEVAEDVFVVLFALFAVNAIKFFEQFFLASGQVGRRHNFDDDMLIAACAAVNYWHTQTFEAEGTIALRAGGYLERGCLAIHGGNINFFAEGRLGKGDRQFVDDVVALPFEDTGVA